MTTDLASWLLARIAEDQQFGEHAEDRQRAYFERQPAAPLIVRDLTTTDMVAAGDGIIEVAPPRWLVECDVKRRIVEEHRPRLRRVEWPDDITGQGEAFCCGRCRDTVSSYVLSPCLTLRILALPYADHAGYRDSWGL